uniref:Uncharacterized protein n=1 Tax=Arundo donax TaxID=35708 RepID=A0A0A9B894_ARUDO
MQSINQSRNRGGEILGFRNSSGTTP